MQTTLQALHRPKLIYRLFKASGRPVNFLISRSETGLNGRTGLLQAVYPVKQDVYRLVTIQIFYKGVLWSENGQEPTVILYPDIDLILINTHP